MAELRSSSKTGVVFSSGFFGFFAHAGFLSAIRDLNITPSGYAGASSGAIVAAMAAAEMTDPAIRKVLFKVKKSDFWDPDPIPLVLKRAFKLFRGYRGYLRGEGFARLLEQIPVQKIEDCQTPLVISTTNLSLQREDLFTHGDMKKAIQASGAVPMLFKPVEINGSLYVDGGMVNKAPVLALADLIQPDRIIIHFIASDNLKGSENSFLKKSMTPWRIHHLSMNISRQEAYRRQCEAAKQRGIEITEVRTNPPGLGPKSLGKGPLAYERVRQSAREILSKGGF